MINKFYDAFELNAIVNTPQQPIIALSEKQNVETKTLNNSKFLIVTENAGVHFPQEFFPAFFYSFVVV